jgi:energy-coupling factor transporter ATP-binding protein EcfA2
MITIEGLATCGVSGAWTESHPAISVDTGETISIIGPSGSGKTALCLAICGLARGIKVQARVTLNGREVTSLPEDQRAALIAYVPTDPSLLFSGIKSTLRGEFELAWQLLSPVSDFSEEHIARAVELFRIEHLMDRDPFTFSGGESTRAAIALALAKRPSVVAIDQAYDSLDSDAVLDIRHAIDTILPEAAIVFETFSRDPCWLAGNVQAHNAAAFLTPTPSGAWHIYTRSRKSDRTTLSRLRACGALESANPSAISSVAGEELLKVRGLEFEYRESFFKLGPLDLSVRTGERVALRGPNGVGKTTLLKCLAMLIHPRYGALEVKTLDGKTVSPPDSKNIHNWAGTALYCFQNPDDQIYLSTVRQELFETARRVGSVDKTSIHAISEHFGLTPFLDVSPFELPRPYRRLVCIAAALAASTQMLLLDEPSAHLDEAQAQMLADALVKFRPAHSACIMVSHDESFIAAAANRTLEMLGMSNATAQDARPHLDPTCATHS